MKRNIRVCDKCKNEQKQESSFYTFTGLRASFLIKSQEGLSMQTGETDICRDCLVGFLDRLDKAAKEQFTT